MESKYYTPSIEEFYVGFEYEVNEDTAENPVWVKQIYMLDYFIYPEFDDYGIDTSELRDGYIRVKYLDKEDIESLGFNETISDQYVLDDIELLIDDDLFVQIIKDNEFLFQGTIKNKSELKQVLKMVGYGVPS